MKYVYCIRKIPFPFDSIVLAGSRVSNCYGKVGPQVYHVVAGGSVGIVVESVKWKGLGLEEHEDFICVGNSPAIMKQVHADQTS